MTFDRRAMHPKSEEAGTPGHRKSRARDEGAGDAQTITLASGWSGLAITARPRGAPDGPGHGTLPSSAEWPRLLSRLLEDPAVMPDYEILKHSDSREVFRARFSWKDNFLNVVCKRSRTRGF